MSKKTHMVEEESMQRRLTIQKNVLEDGATQEETILEEGAIREDYVQERGVEKRGVTYPSCPKRPCKRCDERNTEKEEEEKN